MKHNRPDNFAPRSGGRSHDSGAGEPRNGGLVDLANMLSAVPDADSASSDPSRVGDPQSAAAGGFSDMFAQLPDAEPGEQEPAAVVAPCVLPSPRLLPASRKPVAVPFDALVQPALRGSVQPAVSARQTSLPSQAGGRKSPVSAASEFAEEPANPIDGRDLTQQIMEHLEKHNLAAVSQLRIEVHNGVVVVAGEVPTPYEKQLISHFCRKVPGVEKFVDGMLVRETRAQQPAKRRAPARRPAREGVEWRLPFRAWHGGAALGLVVLVWGAMSLVRGSSGPERLPVFPVAGTVIFEGKPAAGASVFLHSVDGSIPVRPRPAVVNSDGTFAVGTYEVDDGVPAGNYKVTVEWRRPRDGAGASDDEVPPNVLPPAYASPATTPVQVTVEEDENEIPPITFQN